MMNSRLSMNGVWPMMSPVTGSRSGAPGGSVSSSTHHERPPRIAMQRALEALGLPRAGVDRRRRRSPRSDSRRPSPVHGTQPRLDDRLGDDRRGDGEHDGRRRSRTTGWTTIVMRLAARERERLVGDLGDHRVHGAEEQVDAEDRRHARETGGQARQRVPADAHERRGAERDEDQVARRRTRRSRARRRGSG